jgi:hypothetical protein
MVVPQQEWETHHLPDTSEPRPSGHIRNRHTRMSRYDRQ